MPGDGIGDGAVVPGEDGSDVLEEVGEGERAADAGAVRPGARRRRCSPIRASRTAGAVRPVYPSCRRNSPSRCSVSRAAASGVGNRRRKARVIERSIELKRCVISG